LQIVQKKGEIGIETKKLLSSCSGSYLIELSFSRFWSRAAFSTCVFSVSFVVIAARYTRSPETPGRWVKTNEK
jgi:hypothetical protein